MNAPVDTLIVAGDPLNPRRPDPHYERDTQAARDLGLTVTTIDHDLLARGGDPAAATRRVNAGHAIYRGWMLTASQYRTLCDALAERNTTMRTSGAAYRQAHELPGWYPTFTEHTPASVWNDQPAPPDDRLLDTLEPGPAIVKDYVKSMKHYWNEAAYVPDISDRAHLRRVVARLIELRGPDLAGGIVVRHYEQLQPGEIRSWWANGTCVTVTAHPDTPERPPDDDLDPTQVAAAVAALDNTFITVDFARATNGTWRVIEVGDGQVSDLPHNTDPRTLIAAVAGN